MSDTRPEVARLSVVATMADGSTETLLAEHAVEPVEITQLPTYEVPFMFEPLRYRELKFQVAVKFSGPFNIRTQPPAPAEQESTARPADNDHPHELVDALANELLLGCGPLDYTPRPGMSVMDAWRTKISEALHSLRQDGWTVTATPPSARPRPPLVAPLQGTASGTWDVTWQRCPQCPGPLIPGAVHHHVDVTRHDG